ncbi:MAG: hypothetical protein AAF108_00355 [Planctomycetota bacterium]
MLRADPVQPLGLFVRSLGVRGVGGGWLMQGVGFEPELGSITIVEESTPSLGSVLLEVLGGLRKPDTGTAGVRGPSSGKGSWGSQSWGRRSWGSLAAREANRIRGTINWSFQTPIWIETLTLAEGITLEERYHTGRSGRDVIEEAESLCRWFGLPGLPLSLPRETSPEDLRRAELARAFLGDPVAVFLERALADAPDDAVTSTMEAMQRAARRGAAVIYAASATDTSAPPSGGEKRLASLDARRVRLTPRGIVEHDGAIV